ncbi:hypothetical protein GGC65_001296 [Sphingopyxis sp. OAS728]|uniref:hypothetical protein n=1 Tax=Sphingopyxis sp. OAS728 TaxID=2663823 RepID=UPI0017891117|nr:hypothetical protein [Sphingopyxis sp. OAS728]MBE1526840.1 hypothetical protein [Sphingopyxis sp. OAS728]
MIAHFSLPARDPQRTARVFAEIIDGVAMPFPVVPGAWVAIARDGTGLGVEVLPQSSAHNMGEGDTDPARRANGPEVMPWEVQIRQDGAAQAASGFHVALTSNMSGEAIIELGRKHGWRAVACDRGGVFDLVELWIDNRFLVEVLPPEGTARYRSFYRPEVAGQMFGAAI